MIKREYYLSQIRGFYDTDLIKIITGIRRSGKSVILEQVMTEVKKKSSNIIYLNFEDQKIISNIPDADALIDYIELHKKPGLNYLFFDEIQEVKDWQVACKTLRLHGDSIFVTGSNSRIISKECTDAFSGRYVSFKIRPFVYKEILEYTAELGRESSVADYLVWGGFPKRFEFSNSQDRDRYLNELNESIIKNDLINRYKIKNEELFTRVVNYVLRSNSRIFSARSIEDYLKNEHINGSINTIISYLNHLEEAFIIERIKPYSLKTKSELSYTFKVYDADVSLNSIRVMDNRYDLTHNLENIVYNELVFMGYEINVYSNSGKEIDFLAQKNGKSYYIQVAYSVAEEKAYGREMGAFATLDNANQKILITNDDLDYSTSTVRHIRLENFLKLESLE
ncbi:ATP-binding protein [Candidatus Saccharibacteria bacterium]|nr:ATP-binding protein [Candidatus Saccharibacteria bacterium]